jgi:hypothetical protein
MSSKHISDYLDFKPDDLGIRYTYDNRDKAILLSGSIIYRKTSRKGTGFQLFLNKIEYDKIRNSNIEGLYHAHFYGGNYIWLPECSHIIISICEYMGWINIDKNK